MREMARHASALTIQRHDIERLQTSVDTGQVTLINHITGFASQLAANSASIPLSASSEYMSTSRVATKTSRYGKSRRFRVSLPRWLVGRIWELGLHQCDNVWTVQLASINVRPARTYVFDFVRAGDVEAVRKLLNSGQLSVQDREYKYTWQDPRTLLEASLMHQNIS